MDGVAIVSAVWKLMSRVDSEPVVGWKAELKNSRGEAVSVTLKIQLLDADGFEVENDLADVNLQGHSTKPVTGRTSELDTAVAQVRIEIQSCYS